MSRHDSKLSSIDDIINSRPQARKRKKKQRLTDTSEIRKSNRNRPDDEFVGSIFQPGGQNKQRGVFAPVWAIQVTRTLAELLVLSQLAYWFGIAQDGRIRARIVLNGYYWVAKTYKKLARDISSHLTKDMIRAAVRALKDRNLLISADDVEAGHIVRYRLNPLAIRNAVAEVEAQTASSEDDDDE